MDGQVLTHADLVKIMRPLAAEHRRLLGGVGGAVRRHRQLRGPGRYRLVHGPHDAGRMQGEPIRLRGGPKEAVPRGSVARVGDVPLLPGAQGAAATRGDAGSLGLLEVSGLRVFRTKGHEPGQGYWRNEDPWCFTPRFNDGEVQMLLSAMSRIKVRVGASDFHSMLHERLMRPVIDPRSNASSMAAWAEVKP